jgi:hypothetical protein
MTIEIKTYQSHKGDLIKAFRCEETVIFFNVENGGLYNQTGADIRSFTKWLQDGGWYQIGGGM